MGREPWGDDDTTDPSVAGEQAERYQHERDLLASALGDLLADLGVVARVPLTGPELLAAAGGAGHHYRSRLKDAEDVIEMLKDGSAPSVAARAYWREYRSGA